AAAGFETHFHFRRFFTLEVRRAPLEDQARGRLPNRHATGFSRAFTGFGVERLEQAPTELGFETEHAALAPQAILQTVPPPRVDFQGKHLERLARLDCHEHADPCAIARDSHRLRALLRFSACALKAVNWSPQNASTSSSHARSSSNGSRSRR